MAIGLLGTIGNVPTLTIGGMSFPNVISSPPIVLETFVGAGQNSTFRLPGASAGYQVTGGKTLTVYALFGVNDANTSVACGIIIAQTSLDTGWFNTNSGGTIVYPNGNSGNHNTSLVVPGGTGLTAFSYPFFPVAAANFITAYPDSQQGLPGGSSLKITLIGYEA